MTDLNTSNHTGFLPDFCSVRVLFIVVLSAELLAIILSLAQPVFPLETLFDLAMNSLFIQWIALTCVGLLCFFKRYLNQLSEQRAALLSYVLILLVSFLISELAWWSLYIYPNRSIEIPKLHFLFIFRTMSIAAIIGAVVLRYLYIQHQWRKNIEAVAISRLEALQSRIRPHFLFNCMNTIASLTRKSPDLAEEAVEDLADLFRASLLEPTNLYKIEDEWAVCKHYLRIEGHRLGNRLIVDWKIDTVPNDALVPPLSLQPLLENTIYHGIERLSDGGTIKIEGALKDKTISLSFTNPVPEDDREDTHKGNKHAQENIRQRLLNVFGEQSSLSIRQIDHLYTVTVTIPYKRYEDIDR